jgi:DNA repair protein RecO (recombination protein O)
MFDHYKTCGIFLKKIDRGEADQLFTIYTKDFGRLEILGKGIRKMTSKLRAQAAIFCVSDIEFIQGKAGKTLTDAAIRFKFPNIKSDLKKTAAADEAVQAVIKAVKGQEPDEKLWRVIFEYFLFLENFEGREPFVVFQHFFWNTVSLLGYRPRIYGCCLCGKALSGNFYFSFDDGGICCSSCAEHKRKQPVDAGIEKILRIFMNNDLKTVARINLSASQKRTLETLSKNFLLTIT